MNFVTILLASYRQAVWQHRRHRAVYWLTILILVFAILGSLALHALRQGCAGPPRLEIAQSDVQSFAFDADNIRADHQRCPMSTREIFPHRRYLDPWGRPYAIVCNRAEVRVCSLGPDLIATADNICSDDLEPPRSPSGW